MRAVLKTYLEDTHGCHLAKLRSQRFRDVVHIVEGRRSPLVHPLQHLSRGASKKGGGKQASGKRKGQATYNERRSLPVMASTRVAAPNDALDAEYSNTRTLLCAP